MATIRDIAEKLGVSLGTVSKGLNGGQDISEDMRRSILEAAAELGYVSRRQKARDSRGLITVFVENMTYEEPGQFVYEIILGLKKCLASDYRIQTRSIDTDFQKSCSYSDWMEQNDSCASFFMGFALDDPWMQECGTTSIPTLLLDNTIPSNPRVGTVSTDSEEGIDMAIRHLAALGHEKIAFLNGSAGSMISDTRMLFYLQSMMRHHLPIDPNLAVYGYYVAEAARYHVPGFLDAGVTAILCGNDLIAKGVLACVQEAGFSVPGDISVVGFDDLPLAASLTPPLTTVRQSLADIGWTAGYVLHAMMNNIPISRTMLRPELIIRKSTAIAKPRLAIRHLDEKDSVVKVNPQLYSQFLQHRLL